MKILIFNWRCWLNPSAGGAEVFTREVAKRWVKAGNNVTLFGAEFEGCKREETADGVRIVRAGGRYSVYRRAKEYYAKLFSGEGYDVVVDEINTRPFLTPKFVCKGEAIVALIHQLAREYWFYETPFPLSYIGYYWLEPRWLKNYVKTPTITVSESTRMDLVKLGFSQVCVVSEGVGFDPCKGVPEKEQQPTCIYVGRLTKAKRPQNLLKAFELVKQRVPRARLWILGDGYMKQKLESQAFEDVTFFGRVTEQEKIAHMKRSWVLVNPSVREGFGLNIIEANACGTPCIAYDVPGLRDTIRDGETGILVRDDDVRSLADVICHVLVNDAARFRLTENALRFSTLFSWEKAANNTMEAINMALKRD